MVTAQEIRDIVGDVVARQIEEITKAAEKRHTDSLAEAAAQEAAIKGRAREMFDGIEHTSTPASRAEATRAIGRIFRAVAASKGDPERAVRYAKQQWAGDEGVVKALGAQDSAAGGFLIPEQWSQEVIEFLRPATIFRKLEPIVLPMPEGVLNIPRITAGASASWIGENSNVGTTALQTGNVKLDWKKLAALVPISNDLLRVQAAGADTIIRDDLVRAMAQAEDLAFIRNDGTAASPKGVRYWAQSANVFTSAGTSTANMITDLSTAILKLENANVRFIRPAWMISPRTKISLMTAQNSQGFYVFRAEMLTGKLWNYPFMTTTQIPINLGSGSDTEIYLVDFADAVIGESTSLIVDASTEAAYYDGANVQAAFSLDQTVVRAILREDLVMRHDFSVAVCAGGGPAY